MIDYQGMLFDLFDMWSDAMLWSHVESVFGHYERARQWLDLAFECLEFEREVLTRMEAA